MRARDSACWMSVLVATGVVCSVVVASPLPCGVLVHVWWVYDRGKTKRKLKGSVKLDGSIFCATVGDFQGFAEILLRWGTEASGQVGAIEHAGSSLISIHNVYFHPIMTFSGEAARVISCAQIILRKHTRQARQRLEQR